MELPGKTKTEDVSETTRDVFTPAQMKALIRAAEGDWKGAIRHLRERINDAPSEKVRVALEELVSPVECPECHGQRLQPESLAVRVGDLGIADYTALPVDETVEVFDRLTLNEREEQIAGRVLRSGLVI